MAVAAAVISPMRSAMDRTSASQPASAGLGSAALGMGPEQAPAPLKEAATVTAAPTVAAARMTRTASRRVGDLTWPSTASLLGPARALAPLEWIRWGGRL